MRRGGARQAQRHRHPLDLAGGAGAPDQAPLQIVDGCINLPERPGLGVELDREQLQKAHQLYLDNCLGGRDDAVGMQYLIPGWTFDPKRPCLVR